ncbi:MAG TPA: glycoside hydrolase domain-containing protein, partial [Armatimonadota bacterium]
KVKMSAPRLSLGMWDYCYGKGLYGMNEKNMSAAMVMMRTHFLDSPWSAYVLDMPSSADFDAENKLKVPPKFDRLDQWLKAWPDAKRYFIFPSVQPSFAGVEMGTKEFDARVGEWVRALAVHLRSVGIDPEQVALLLRDEPGETDALTVSAWARPIKASGAGIRIFQDSTPARPDLSPNLSEALKLSDIVCPRLLSYMEGGKDADEFYDNLQAKGEELWFYSCEGPTRQFDPYLYYRLSAWYAFKHDAKGISFWAFGDTGFGKNSWNEYAEGGTSYTPVFISPESVTGGIHWEAVREGIEDYEYLSMLRDAARVTTDESAKAEAEVLLAETDAVLGKYVPSPDWSATRDRSGADNCRLKILRLLERLQ